MIHLGVDGRHGNVALLYLPQSKQIANVPFRRVTDRWGRSTISREIYFPAASGLGNITQKPEPDVIFV